MKSLEEFSCPTNSDQLSMAELNAIEKALDQIFKEVNVDVTFTKHFKERINDKRNKTQISRCELLHIFKELKQKHSFKGNPKDIERLIKSITTDINIPIVIKWNRGKHEIELVTKTIMRKKGFKSSTQVIKVEGNTMQKFQEFKESQNSLNQSILEMVFIMDTDIEKLNEMIDDESGEMLHEALNLSALKGMIHASKGKGLISYFKSGGIGIAKLLIAAVKGDKEGIQKVLKSVKKEEFLDFLLKLDQASLHLITGPIHAIEAITGWHIWANIHTQAGNSLDKIKKAIAGLKKDVSDFFSGSKSKKINMHLTAIDNSLAFGS